VVADRHRRRHRVVEDLAVHPRAHQCILPSSVSVVEECALRPSRNPVRRDWDPTRQAPSL
jgi:hypothetical protein